MSKKSAFSLLNVQPLRDELIQARKEIARLTAENERLTVRKIEVENSFINELQQGIKLRKTIREIYNILKDLYPQYVFSDIDEVFKSKCEALEIDLEGKDADKD